MIIPGAKRAFGVGETKGQNAVIKVYSAAELKAALTKVYQLPSNVGTIEIAGDIVITEPIKLRRFLFGESAPKEIIIQAVSGAKIINGRTTIDQGYTWNDTGNTGIPIFDFGVISITPNPLTKYTFKDLTINTESAYPFGAIVAGDINTASTGNLGLITLTNIKMFNVASLFGAYDSSGVFTVNKYITILNPKVQDILYRNSSAFSMTTTYFNSNRAGCYAGNITGIGVWNTAQQAQTEDSFTINNNLKLIDCNFTNIFANVIVTVPDRTRVGQGNTLSGIAEISSTNQEAGFSYINTNLPSGSPSTGNSTYLKTISATQAFGYGTGRIVSSPTGSITTTPNTFSFIGYSAGNGAAINIDFDNATIYSHYIVDWSIVIKQVATELVNAYNIKTTLSITNAGVGTILDNSTQYAFEQILATGLTGLIPSWNNATRVLSIAPAVGVTALNCVCNITVTGLKHPNLG